MNWIFLILAIISEVIATSALKSSVGFTKLYPSILVITGYTIAFYFLSLTLRTIPVAVAYSIWAGVGTAAIAVVAWFFLNQKLDLPAIVGISLIIIGVIIINLFSNISGH